MKTQFPNGFYTGKNESIESKDISMLCSVNDTDFYLDDDDQRSIEIVGKALKMAKLALDTTVVYVHNDEIYNEKFFTLNELKDGLYSYASGTYDSHEDALDSGALYPISEGRIYSEFRKIVQLINLADKVYNTKDRVFVLKERSKFTIVNERILSTLSGQFD